MFIIRDEREWLWKDLLERNILISTYVCLGICTMCLWATQICVELMWIYKFQECTTECVGAGRQSIMTISLMNWKKKRSRTEQENVKNTIFSKRFIFLASVCMFMCVHLRSCVCVRVYTHMRVHTCIAFYEFIFIT